MAEDKFSETGGSSSVAELEKSEVEQELDRSRGDSDELSGSLSEGEDSGQRRGSDNDQKQRRGRRQRRLKGGKRHHRKHHPYAGTSYAERVKIAVSEYPHAPRNTTQYLIEDHVKSNISPDLSNKASPASNCDETTEAYKMISVVQQLEEERGGLQDSPQLGAPFTPTERLDKEFVAVYDNVNEDRLHSMSKEELIRMTSMLLKTAEVGRRAFLDNKMEHYEQTDGVRDSPGTTTVSSCN